MQGQRPARHGDDEPQLTLSLTTLTTLTTLTLTLTPSPGDDEPQCAVRRRLGGLQARIRKPVPPTLTLTLTLTHPSPNPNPNPIPNPIPNPNPNPRCATCHLEYGQHSCCGHFLRSSEADAPESKGCKQCGLRWPEHQACPKFGSGGHDGAAPETGDGAACETCGVPVNGHTVCDGYDKDAEGGRCGGAAGYP